MRGYVRACVRACVRVRWLCSCQHAISTVRTGAMCKLAIVALDPLPWQARLDIEQAKKDLEAAKLVRQQNEEYEV